MGLDQIAGKRKIEQTIAQYGCLPDAANSGQLLPRFNAKMMGDAILAEVKQARRFGFTRITIHLEPQDAIELAKFLRDGR